MRCKPFIACLLALLPLVSSCRRGQLEPMEPATLEVRLFIPEALLTRAKTGDEAALDPEKLVTDLHLWIYRAGSTAASGLIGHRELSTEQLEAMGVQNGQTARFTIPLTKQIAEEKPNVDVYAVLNGASVGLTLSAFPSANNDWSKVDPDDLEDFVMQGDVFGVTTPVHTVPATGLPMAGMKKNVAVTGTFPVLRIEDVVLTRAVSKLHFVFTQLATGTIPVASFTIQNITLTGQIGATEKLFTENTLTNGALCDINGYTNLSKTYPTDEALPTSLASTERPGYFLYDTSAGMTSQEYADRIQEGIASRELTEWNLCYFRESDKQLTGTITYQIGTAAAKTATFTMEAEGDFARNHSWTIYGYFIGGKLYLHPTVLPWIAGHDRLSYSTMGSTEMKYERPWLRYDLDQKSWTWNDTYVAIAYGYRGNSTSGMPTRSPRITFETINQNELRLQLNNSHFRLVQVTHGLDSENNVIDVFTQLAPGAYLTIPGSRDLQTTEVYVVPENDDPMTDPYVKLMLTEIHPGGIPPENLPFNHNLPGDEDHASILFYNPGATEWDSNKNNHKINGDTQPEVYWLEEEGTT